MVEEVVFGVVVADETVESFNRTDYKMRVSLAAGVPVSCITLRIQAGSVNVTATIRPEYDSAVNASVVKENLLSVLSDNGNASVVLGVTVEEIFAAPDVHTNHYSPPTPPPPSTPVVEEDSVGLILGLTLGAAFLAAIAAAAFCCRSKKPGVPVTATGENQSLNSPAAPVGEAATATSLQYAKADEHTRRLANAFATSVGSPKMATVPHGKVGPQKRNGAGRVPLLRLGLAGN